ncbi:MAG: winged helix-turn-helix transcriptional regulator [Succinivibrio sp.]|nr:winged helix-turn-helix transcriptional regulator [Succinivibrio sp.]
MQVGKFTGAEVDYHDMLEGPLITTAFKIADLIYWKYLKAKISYEHDRRVETFPFSRIAVRESIFNAMIHNAYMFGVPIQIRIQNDEMIISNSCILPEGWTLDYLTKAHASIPYNPTLAQVFYRAGFIEHWGRGIEKIFAACRALGTEPPYYELVGNILRVHLKALPKAIIVSSDEVSHENEGADKVSDIEQLAVNYPKANGTGTIGTNSVTIDTNSGTIDTNSGTIGTNSGTIGTNSGTIGTNQDSKEKIISDVTPLESGILELLKDRPEMTQHQLSETLSISIRTVKRAISTLIKNNKLERIGNNRSGIWQVKNPAGS